MKLETVGFADAPAADKHHPLKMRVPIEAMCTWLECLDGVGITL